MSVQGKSPMSDRDPRLVLNTAPFLRVDVTTPGIMRDVILSTVPVIAVSTWIFGPSALLVVLAAVVGACGVEWLFSKQGFKVLLDGSALLTGILLGLTLPPGIPMWMAFLGGLAGVGLGKVIWGGLGHNLFNPALVGRAFLQAAFPITLTTWMKPLSGADWFHLGGGTLALPFMQPSVEVISSATPMGLQKFQHELTPVLSMFTGDIGGSLGETSAIVIVLAGVYLLWRRAVDWRIPASIILTVVVFSTVLWLVNPALRPPPTFALFSGGLLFGAIYMATDPVTSPTSPLGAWIFGAGIGFLVVLIRQFGGLPEGVMYAILLMNAASPLIERFTQPRVFGRGKR